MTLVLFWVHNICIQVCGSIALHVQAAAKAKKVVDKEKKARDGLKKIEVGLAL